MNNNKQQNCWLYQGRCRAIIVPCTTATETKLSLRRSSRCHTCTWGGVYIGGVFIYCMGICMFNWFSWTGHSLRYQRREEERR